jgi:peptide subunit release factor RF-3
MASRSLSSPSSSWLADRLADGKKIEDFVQTNYSSCAEDLDGDKVFMARNQFILDYTRERALGISFTDIKDVKDTTA